MHLCFIVTKPQTKQEVLQYYAFLVNKKDGVDPYEAHLPSRFFLNAKNFCKIYVVCIEKQTGNITCSNIRNAEE